MLDIVTLVNKYKAFKQIDGGQSCIATTKKYGVAKNTILHWLKKKPGTLEGVEGKNVLKKRKRIKTSIHEELNSVTYKWLKAARHSDIPLNCKIFTEKALEFTNSLEFRNFHASDVWLGRWKNVSVSPLKLFQVTKHVYRVFGSCCFKMFIKLPSAEKDDLQGRFIPFLSP